MGLRRAASCPSAKNDDIREETLGCVMDGAEVRITDQGEITYRHPGIFLGYYNNPGKTAEVLRDGWFHSGDCGSITGDGHLVLLDRLGNQVLLESGDRLVPQLVESRLRFSPHIKDAWVFARPRQRLHLGDNRN